MKNETENETCECGMNKEEHYSPWKIEGACKKFKPLAYDYKNSNYNRMEDTQTPEYKTYPYRDGKKDGVELNRAVVTDKTSGDSVPDQFCLSSKRKYTKKDGLFDKLRVHSLDKHIVYPEEDIKEFVRLIQSKVLMYWKGQNEFIDWLNKKAGEKLIK